MKKNVQGFSLIEVLISIFVLALGAIGAAGMQLTALRTSQQSAFQTVALHLASEMADKIRANDAPMKLKDNVNPFLMVNYQSASEGEPSPPQKLCHVGNCTSDELAEFEIYEWKKRIKAHLPSGRVLICRDVSPWDAATKAFTWTCDPGVGESTSLVIKVGWQAKNPDGSLVKDASKQFPPLVAITVEPYIK